MAVDLINFNDTIARFSKLEDARDKLWERARKMLLNGYEVEAYILILSTWNFADFRYFLKNLDIDHFNKIIFEINPVFKKIKDISFENADFYDPKLQKDIKFIYTKLKEIVRQTGTSKVMALKKPDLFVMWDTAIRKMYKIDIKANAEDYLEFLIKMKSEFGEIQWNNKNSDLAKAIDEYNYVLVEEKRRIKKQNSLKNLNRTNFHE